MLGSGWASFPLATSLDPRKYQVILVSPRSYFVFTPLLAEAACGTIELRTTVEPVRDRRRTHIQYVQAWADSVDFEKKKVRVEEAVVDPRQGLGLTAASKGEESKDDKQTQIQKEQAKGKTFDLDYDKLVIGVGCYLQTFGTPGVKEHAYFLKDVGDARKIRRRLLECFEMAAMPTITEQVRQQLLTFAIVGGGPTGVEFAAELHDIVFQDLRFLFPEISKQVRVIVYDVAPKVLSMFDAKLGEYAMDTLRREKIEVRTSRKIQALEPGLPGVEGTSVAHTRGLTLKVKDEPDLGIGMCVWSTGLARNPFVEKSLGGVHTVPSNDILTNGSMKPESETKWRISQDGKTGSVVTDHQLRVMLQPAGDGADSETKDADRKTVLDNVFAIGDCAMMQDTMYPATAQVASQKGYWLAKRLNKNDLDTSRFEFKNLGTMAYLGGANAIMQSGSKSLGNVSGRMAWVIWKGAYLTKTLSWRNKILLPIYW